MNERIRELAREAGGHNNISKFRGHFLPPEPGYIDPATVDLSKFAELIVEDCVRQINLQCFPTNSHEWCEKGAWNGYLVAQIHQHFGVE